ncbi:MAG TPA: hypothetical protein VN457_03165, partial [Chlamydiales bacterium]|nr:hypothetical protein [Chlamydiales bacterium]
MEKQKRWQLFVIVAVLLLTLYNILPTIIYYSKPLREPIGPEQAKTVAIQIAARVDQMEANAEAWIGSFCDLIHVTPSKIYLNPKDPSVIEVQFKDKKEADRFRRLMPPAGLEIAFVPAQLGVVDQPNATTTVHVARR